MRKIECDRCLKELTDWTVHVVELVPPDRSRDGLSLLQSFDCCRDCMVIVKAAITTAIASEIDISRRDHRMTSRQEGRVENGGDRR